MRITGTGSSHPSLVVTNDKLAKFLETSDEWIQTRTGIKQRQLITSERLEDLAADAAFKAIDDAGISSSDLDMIICSNVLNEYITPSLSSIVQGIIGASCPCIDVNVACAGFVYALDVANAYMRIGRMHNILVMAAEEPTRMVDWKDRSTCVLFGDGAGAAVVSDGEGFKASHLGAAGDPSILYEKRNLCPTPFISKEEKEDGFMKMAGKEVYKLAVRYSADDIDGVLNEGCLAAEDIDWFLMHQANKRIIETIAKYLNQPMAKFPMTIQKYGNSSSASLPMLLDEMNRSGKLKNGDNIILSAFGAGFCSGACLMVWNK